MRAVLRELDEQRQALGGDLVGQTVEAGDQPVVRLFVEPEQMFDACAPGGHLDALRDLIGREDVENLLQRLVALRELTGGGERLRHRQQQRDALVSRCRVRQHPQRRGQPPCGRRGRLRASFLARRPEHRHRSRHRRGEQNARRGVRVHSLRAPRVGQSRRDALVRADTPASRVAS